MQSTVQRNGSWVTTMGSEHDVDTAGGRIGDSSIRRLAAFNSNSN
jgi:hypothetical protein